MNRAGRLARAGLVAVAAAGAAAIAWVIAFGVTLDASRWRPTLETRLAETLGRPLRLVGPLRITLGRELAIEVRDARLAAPPQGPTADLAHIDLMIARMRLADAIARNGRVRSVEVSGARVTLARDAQGANNWTFAGANGGATPAWSIDGLSLRGVTLAWHDAGAAPQRLLDLAQASIALPAAQALTISLQGKVLDTHACALNGTGGTLDALLGASTAWPMALALDCGGARATARGTLDARTPAVRLTVEGVIADTSMRGTLAAAFDGPRARVTGDLTVAEFVLPPAPADGGGDAWTARAVPWPEPLPVDVTLALQVASVAGLPISLRDLRATVSADAERIEVPFTIAASGVPVAGSLAVTHVPSGPTMRAHASARDVPLADIVPGMQGSAGRLDVEGVASGATYGALVAALDARVEVQDAQVAATAGDRRIGARIASLLAVAAPGKPVRVEARGTLQGEAIQARVRSLPLAALVDTDAIPFKGELRGAGARARFEATLARDATRGEIGFDVDAARAGSLARWLGVAPQATLPLAARGRAVVDGDAWRIDDGVLRLGRSDAAFHARRTMEAGTPRLTLSVHGKLLDVPELETLRPPRARARLTAPSLDATLLPHDLSLADADIGVGLERMVLGRVELEQVGFAAKLRDGRLEASPVAARIAGVPVDARVVADLHGDVPEIAASFTAEAVDAGLLLRRLAVADVIEETAERLHVDFSSRGATLRELLEHTAFDATLSGGALTVRMHALPTATMKVDTVRISARPGEPVRAAVRGAVAGAPATLDVTAGTLVAIAETGASVPLKLEASMAGTHLALEGEAAIPLGRGGALTIAARGDRLDSLTPLVRAELPPWGPWTVRGPASLTPTGHAVTALTLTVGESVLNGRAALNLSGERPRMDVHLHAPRISLDDFPTSVMRGAGPAGGTQEALATARAAADETERLLGGRLLRRFDGSLQVTLDDVAAGEYRLADARLGAKLENGRLTLERLDMRLPGGTAHVAGTFERTADGIEMGIAARASRFEYGIIARRWWPEDDFNGQVSVDVDLRGRAPSIDQFLAHADGRFDFAIRPRNLGSGVLDRWSINAIRTLLPFLDRSGESTVNCYIARFDLAGGQVRDHALIIDTTRVRATGTGGANLIDDTFSFRFSPRAKGVTFFSLQTPLRVEGSSSNVRVFVAPGDWLEALTRFFGSVILVPLDIWRNGPMPIDGADVCVDAVRDH